MDLKKRIYITVIISHLVVLLALFAPIIRVIEGGIMVEGESLLESYYINVVQYVLSGIHIITSVLLLILVFFHLCGIAVAIYGMIRKGYGHKTVNLTVFLGFTSGLMGALNLYSKSYALFAVCAVSFVTLTACSVLLIRAESRQG